MCFNLQNVCRLSNVDKKLLVELSRCMYVKIKLIPVNFIAANVAGKKLKTFDTSHGRIEIRKHWWLWLIKTIEK